MPHPVPDPDPVILIQAEGAGLGRLLETWRGRGVWGALILRELQVRYRQAFLGSLWALAQPLALAFAVAFVVGRVAPDAPPAPVSAGLMAFTALVPWTFFQTAILGAVPSLVQNSNLVRKIWFPRECLPLAVVVAVGLDLVVGMGAWLAWLTWEGGHPGWALFTLPLWLLLLGLTTAAVALLGSALNVRWRDVKHALPVALQVGLLICPVAWRASQVPEAWRTLYALNPLVAVMEGMRATGLEGRWPDAALVWPGIGTLLVLVPVALLVFLRAERRFADVI